MKRVFDIIVSLVGLLLCSPLLLLIALWVKFDSPGPVFFVQPRVGRNNKDFDLIKFRSMTHQRWADGQLITVGNHDPRITRSGYYLRRYKLDELPQLINVLKGDMSLVGPRPLVRQQVEVYFEQYEPILSVRPGITSEASLYYSNEDELLGAADNPEKLFCEELLPKKIELNMHYVRHHSFAGDIRLLLRTFWVFITGNRKK
ncbi:MAG: sugar transferase [Porphyromonas sp.]|nr:sugar transferase [Porphyromonas sp.]